MVVPFADQGCARHRRVLRQPANDLIELDGALGLHPGMREAPKRTLTRLPRRCGVGRGVHRRDKSVMVSGRAFV